MRRRMQEGAVTMKKITLIPILLLFILFGIYIAAQDSYAIDAPHDFTNSITCNSSCHIASNATASWQTQPTGTPTMDYTYANNLCKSCHIYPYPGVSPDAQDVQTHSSVQTSATYSVWEIECRVCHNPHYQMHVTTFATTTMSAIVTGTITAIAPAGDSVQVSTSLTPSIYVDYILIPDVTDPATMYRIIDNDTSNIYVSPVNPIDTGYIVPGASFAIRYPGYIKQQISTPNSGLKTVRFFNNAGVKSFASSSTTIDGVCQVCHTKTKYFNNVTGASNKLDQGHQSAPAGSNCVTCHKHKVGFKADCSQCHGSPPIVNTKGGPDGLVLSGGTGSTGATLAGAHARHAKSLAYDCTVCHDNYSPAHRDGTYNIKIGFSISGTKSGFYDGQATANYISSNGVTTVGKSGSTTCGNIYCHSSGQGSTSNNATPVYATPNWNTPSSGACGKCHGTTSATLTTGNHKDHLSAAGFSIGCNDCHTGAAGDASTYNSPNHVNKLIDVDAAKGYSAGSSAAPGNGYGTCGSATACHGRRSPTWGMDVTNIDKCTVCHGTPTAYPAPEYAKAPGKDLDGNTTGAKAGAHQAHLTSNPIGRIVRCDECHSVVSNVTDTGHLNSNGVAIVTFAGSTVAMANNATPSYYASAGTCNNTYCHGAAMWKATTAGTDTHPMWSDTSYLTGTASNDCNKCHGYPPTQLSIHNGMGPSTCKGCHSDANAAGTGFDTVSMHVDGHLDVSGCTGCHGASDGTGKGAPLQASDLLKVITGHTEGMNARHIKTTELNYACDTCHDQNGMPTLDSKITISFKPTGLPSGGTYLGSAFTGTFSYSYSSNVTTTIGGAQACANLYCHGGTMATNGGTDITPEWTNAATGACGSCHGATAANPPTLGGHVKHAASFTGAGYQVACTTCHVNYLTQHVDGLSEVAFDPAVSTVVTGSYSGSSTMLDAYGTCSSIYCHSNGTGGSPLVTNFTWSTSLNCAGCHGGLSSNTSPIATGKHTQHIATSAGN